MINPEALKEIARLFQDPKTACVSGEKRVAAKQQGDTAAEGEGLYWKYESTLKKWDSELNSAMGAAGELFAIRTSLYQTMPEDTLLDDFMISMLMVKDGYRIAYTSDAYALEYGSADMAEEAKRKRRIAAGGLQSIARLKSLLLPLPNPHLAAIRIPPCAALEPHTGMYAYHADSEYHTRHCDAEKHLSHHTARTDALLHISTARTHAGEE